MWNSSFCFCGTRTKHCEHQFVMRGRFILWYCFIRHKWMENKHKSNKCRLLLSFVLPVMPGAFMCDLLLQCIIKKKIPNLKKKKKHTWLSQTSKQQHARPSRGTVSLYWDMGQHSWDRMTCSNLDHFPSEPHWPSVCPSSTQASCSREERATSTEYCIFKYRCWTNIIAQSHLWAVLPGSVPAWGWCTISFQQLQFIFTLCISQGDIKWHRSHSHLISFSGSCLCCDESFHLLFIAGWWRDRAAGVSKPNVLCTGLRQWIKTSNITFPVCRKDDYGPITAPLYPYAAHSYSLTPSH